MLPAQALSKRDTKRAGLSDWTMGNVLSFILNQYYMANKKKNYGVDACGNSMKTQVAVIKNYCLTTGRKVSQMMVTEKWGFTRLSAIIYDLKDQPKRAGGIYEVRDEIATTTNRFGNVVRYKNYWIEKVA